MLNVIDPCSIIQRKSGLLSCNVDDETVLFDTDLGAYLGMNPIASRIWELIEKPKDINSICEGLMEEFAIDRARCFEEVTQFLKEMLELKIIQLNTP